MLLTQNTNDLLLAKTPLAHVPILLVLRAALRVLEDQKAREQALVQAIIEGENSGVPQPFDRQTHRQNMLDRRAAQSE